MHTWIIWLNLIGATASGWSNLYATWIWRNHRFQAAIYISIALFAWMYAWGYIFLLVTDDIHAWVSFFSVVSVVVWPLVWSMPSIVSSKARKTAMCQLHDKVQELETVLDARAAV